MSGETHIRWHADCFSARPNMMNTVNAGNSAPKLDKWLNSVNSHLDRFKADRRPEQRKQRNRARELARREARQLFRDYEVEQATSTT